jgi:hypothetical protein
MADRPILFSGPMVRALLASTKTQTRRVLSGLGDQPIVEYDGMYMWKQDYRWGVVSNPKFPPGVRFSVGDRLYVREAWRTGLAYEDLSPSALGGDEQVLFEADGATERWTGGSSEPGRVRQGMHMPRWASRLTLTVTEVRVQRLQEICHVDAAAEGCLGTGQYPDYDVTPRDQYRALWDSLNADRGFGWDVNPWCVAVSFSVEHRNIDQVHQ